jgi:hypothetical protein
MRSTSTLAPAALALALLLALGGFAPRSAGGQELAIAKADLDAAACRSYQDGVAKSIDEGELWSVVGLVPPNLGRPWRAGEKPNDGKTGRFGYLFVFKQPVAVGSLFMRATAGKVFALRPGVPLPKTPKGAGPNAAAAKETGPSKDWLELDVPASQSGALVVPCPAGFTTQALWLVDERSEGASQVESLRLFKARWQNMVPAALAYASHEYYRPPADFVTPFLYEAALVTRGTETWYSAGKGKDGRVSTPPISDLHPEWFMLVWEQPHTIKALWVHGNAREWSLEQYTGPESVNPRVGTQREWRSVKDLSEQNGFGRWIVFDKPLTTRGLRLNITKVDGQPQIAWIDGLHVLEDLGSRAPRELAGTGPKAERPPFEIPLDLKSADNLTLVVNDAEGRRVRNLVARVPAAQGKQSQGWDLKDEQGGYVPPGEYQWQAITCPTLQPRYEFTVYPNVTENAPENPPWLTGASGPGGWLADHCNNSAVCAVGDRVFLAAYMAESGVALIECNLQGHKHWGHPGFADWTGVGQLASDGKTLFNAATINGGSAENVWAIDVESKQIRPLISRESTSQRQRGFKGLAAAGGRFVLSVSAPADWLASAAAPDDVDVAACYPLYPPPRKPKIAFEPIPNPRSDFMRLFRLVDTPPGTSAQGSLVYLQSMRDAAPQQHIVLSFRREVPIGSVVLPRVDGKDVHLRVSMLKPQAAFPPQASDERAWIDFPEQLTSAWDVLAAPTGATTRALRLSFVKGALPDKDDLLSTTTGAARPDDSFELGQKNKPSDAAGDFGSNQDRWQAQLEGLKILRRRFQNLSRSATVRVNSGAVAEDGSWDAKRAEPLTPAAPAIYVHEWKLPQKVRGVAIKEIDARLTKIDVYTGPATGPIDITASENWQSVADYEQRRRYYYHPDANQNHDARYLDGYVDFGRELSTRAVRLRAVEQWADNGDRSLYGVRNDRGGKELEPNRCRVYGLAVVGYAGGEVPVDAKIGERLEVYDATTGKLESEVDIERPGRLTYDRQGNLYATSANRVVKVDLAGGKHKPVLADLESPGDIAFDDAGNLYVSEHGDFGYRIRVFDPAGKFLRGIGHSGPRRAGRWDPEVFGRIVDIDVDREGNLWVVEDEYWPKRVVLFAADGKYEREFLGNTPYGGGGVLDPFDKSRMFVGPLEFELDWKTGHSRLKNLSWTGSTPPGELPIHVDGRIYVATWQAAFSSQCGIVYRYENDHEVLAAAMGAATGFDPLKSPELIARLGGPQLDRLKFVWSDLNSNGAVDAEEVQFSPKPANYQGLTPFDRDLGAQCGRYRYRVKQFLPSGVPVYEEHEGPAALDSPSVLRLTSGSYYRMGLDGRPESGLDAAGETRWTYPTEGAGGHALYSAKPWFPAQVVAQGGFVGHETPADGPGEFCVFNTNAGGWNVMTADGLLIGPVFRDMRDPAAKPWSMSEHNRGLLLKDISLAQEHFQGYFCQSLSDGKYYAVAGHNHASVVEIVGLDQARRYHGTVRVAAEDVKQSQQWDELQEKAGIYARAPVIDCFRLEKAPQLDGKLDDWQAPGATIGQNIRFYIGFDDSHLYLAYSASNLGPFKNSGEQWDRLFKTGACADLHIGVDPEAAVDRVGPVVGDQRLLLAYLGDQPTAVLYRPVLADRAEGQPWHVVSPVNDAHFDDVRELPGVRFVHLADAGNGNGPGYTVEAAVPLSAIGLAPADGMRLKLDWGLLRTGPDGHEVLQRICWANRATSITADAPSEARLHPELWGFVRFHDGKRPSTEDRFEASEVTGRAAGKDKTLKRDIDDILESLDDKK